MLPTLFSISLKSLLISALDRDEKPFWDHNSHQFHLMYMLNLPGLKGMFRVGVLVKALINSLVTNDDVPLYASAYLLLSLRTLLLRNTRIHMVSHSYR